MRELFIYILFSLFSYSYSQGAFIDVRTSIENNDFKKAERILENLEKKKKFLDSTVYYQGILCVKSGKKESAAHFRDRLIKDFPNFTEVHYLSGLIRFVDNDYGKSIDDFNEAIKHNPSHIKALSNRALAKGLLEDYEAAIDDLTKCIELAPGYIAGYYSRGYWYDLSGNFEKATSDYEMTLNLDKKNYDAYLGLAHIYHKKNDNEKACAILDQAIAAGSAVAEEAKLHLCK